MASILTMIIACDYDEEITLCDVSVQLVYPKNSIEPYAGARVEFKDATASVFVDSTDATGTAHFLVPPGIYEASSSEQLLTEDWRYFFNGVKSLNIISPDSANQVNITLTMSRKRVVH